MLTGSNLQSPTLARLAGINDAGEVLIALDDDQIRPARLLADLDRELLGRPEMIGRDVLVVCIEGDVRRPVVIGLLAPVSEPQESVETPALISADGKRLRIDAQEEITLSCGKGSITIRKDGKIVIRGTHLLSRAAVTNRIKGGSVEIN